MDGLTVGRIVHYVDSEGSHLAAIVSWVVNAEEGAVCLHVFDPFLKVFHHPLEPVTFEEVISYAEEPQPNTWHWIERA